MNITERRRKVYWMTLNGHWMVTEMYLPFSRLNGHWTVTEWRLSFFTEWWRFVLCREGFLSCYNSCDTGPVIFGLVQSCYVNAERKMEWNQTEQDKNCVYNSLRIPPPPKHRKGQSHTEVLKVHNVMSYGDTPMCQIWYSCQRAKTTLLKHIFMMIFFTLERKIKVR